MALHVLISYFLFTCEVSIYTQLLFCNEQQSLLKETHRLLRYNKTLLATAFSRMSILSAIPIPVDYKLSSWWERYKY